MSFNISAICSIELANENRVEFARQLKSTSIHNSRKWRLLRSQNRNRMLSLIHDTDCYVTVKFQVDWIWGNGVWRETASNMKVPREATRDLSPDPKIQFLSECEKIVVVAEWASALDKFGTISHLASLGSNCTRNTWTLLYLTAPPPGGPWWLTGGSFLNFLCHIPSSWPNVKWYTKPRPRRHFRLQMSLFLLTISSVIYIYQWIIWMTSGFLT